MGGGGGLRALEADLWQEPVFGTFMKGHFKS